MLVKYYKHDDLKYANRKRYITFNYTSFAEETQKSVLLGDGERTTVKTSVFNNCDYVTIDDTRWFVIHHTFLNGKQIQLELVRDVIGEFGISDMVGNVERGMTDSILKYRKELDLNEILKERISIIPDVNKYGNYTVDNHNNELWGVLYFIRPTEYNPETQQIEPKDLIINIPEFTPYSLSSLDVPLFDDGHKIYMNPDTNIYIEFICKINLNYRNSSGGGRFEKYRYKIIFNITLNSNYEYEFKSTRELLQLDGRFDTELTVEIPFYIIGPYPTSNIFLNGVIDFYSNFYKNMMFNGSAAFTLPEIPSFYDEPFDFTSKLVKDNNSGNVYSFSSSLEPSFRNVPADGGVFLGNFESSPASIYHSDTYGYINVQISNYIDMFYNSVRWWNSLYFYTKTYRRTELNSSQKGELIIDSTLQLVDEPYIVMIFPLFNVNITGNNKSYKIERNNAFMIFNSVIEFLSGENPYIVDAQIYPYCPELINVVSVLSNPSSDNESYPFFSILSNTYNHVCSVKLNALIDVKKEYIKKSYSIVSPEQSGKFTFNYYDYVNEFVENVDNPLINDALMYINIKTSLKPFSIISSAVIIPDTGSIIGITYDSDLRGCSSSSNGFQCSLSSNAFETYKRTNSNYQQIFSLQRGELEKIHQVEKINDDVAMIVNTTSASTMGTIAGSSIGSTFTDIFGLKAASAIAGGSVAGLAVGISMDIQNKANEGLREYEKDLQLQMFKLNIGTIKNIPNTLNRISSFNEIILKDFWYVIETYSCSEYESELVDMFLNNYSYIIGMIGILKNFHENGRFLKCTLIRSLLDVNLHNLASNELKGGIYIYE